MFIASEAERLFSEKCVKMFAKELELPLTDAHYGRFLMDAPLNKTQGVNFSVFVYVLILDPVLARNFVKHIISLDNKDIGKSKFISKVESIEFFYLEEQVFLELYDCSSKEKTWIEDALSNFFDSKQSEIKNHVYKNSLSSIEEDVFFPKRHLLVQCKRSLFSFPLAYSKLTSCHLVILRQWSLPVQIFLTCLRIMAAFADFRKTRPLPII